MAFAHGALVATGRALCGAPGGEGGEFSEEAWEMKRLVLVFVWVVGFFGFSFIL